LPRSGGRLAAVALLALLAAACSSTGPRRPAGSAAGGAQTPAPGQSGADRTASVPQRARQSYARALAAMQAENWTEAELELKDLLLEFDSYPGPYINIAIVYMHENRNDDAMKALKSALALDPAEPAANDEMGILLRREGRFKEAEAAYRRAIAADPGYLLAYRNLGVLLDLYLGRGAEALDCYRHYQQGLAKPDPRVARWIVELKRRVDKSAGPEVAREDGS
jgi:tetratricopeptide (TPR) repeat protein